MVQAVVVEMVSMVGLSVYLTIELTELLTDQMQCQRRVKVDPRFLAGATGRMKLLLRWGTLEEQQVWGQY